MRVYVFQAALLCEDCGKVQREEIERESGSSQQLLETGCDSEGYPQGPYPDGGGEADSPQHCNQCEAFLDNPLTEDGSAYVKGLWREHMDSGRGRIEILHIWRDAYPNEWAEFCEEVEGIPFGDVTPKAARRFYELTGE